MTVPVRLQQPNPEDGEGNGEKVAFGGALPSFSGQVATGQFVPTMQFVPTLSAPKAASHC